MEKNFRLSELIVCGMDKNMASPTTLAMNTILEHKHVLSSAETPLRMKEKGLASDSPLNGSSADCLEPSSAEQTTTSRIKPICVHLIQISENIRKTFIFGVDPGVTKFLYDLIKYRTGCCGRLPYGTTGEIELLGDHLEDTKDCLKRLQVPEEVIQTYCNKGLKPRAMSHRNSDTFNRSVR